MSIKIVFFGRLLIKIEKGYLWIGNMERMDDMILTKCVYRTDVTGRGTDRGCPKII